MRYKIVSASSKMLLEEAVMKWMKRGYVPTGGLAVIEERVFGYDSNSSKTTYLQAIIKLD